MLSEWECKKRWKCPTDRELALRAKVNTGWSIHTANVFLKPQAIQLSELEAIEKVIQRANDLERLEFERIGRMVCNLENVTKNAVGDGERTCFMCGTAFGVFRSSFVSCVDCNKAVCEKCSVDTLTASLDISMLCKICSENREVWKKSGGWFYGKLPTLTEAYQKKCVNEISGSPSSVRAYDTWSHRAPEIVRLQSYQPPEENHNDNTQYASWTMSDKTDGMSTEISDMYKDDKSDYSRNTRCAVISVPDIYCCESLEVLDKTYDNIQHDEVLKMNSISDLDSLRDRNSPPFTKPESPRKCSLEQKQPDINYLSVQSTQLSASCPSLTDIPNSCKLKRKPSIRRKRTSEPIRKKSLIK